MTKEKSINEEVEGFKNGLSLMLVLDSKKDAEIALSLLQSDKFLFKNDGNMISFFWKSVDEMLCAKKVGVVETKLNAGQSR